MFELAAGTLNQEMREREIEAGLRRRQLLAAASTSSETTDTMKTRSADVASPARIGVRRSAAAQR
jgi:hypothetical protein